MPRLDSESLLSPVVLNSSASRMMPMRASEPIEAQNRPAMRRTTFYTREMDQLKLAVL